LLEFPNGGGSVLRETRKRLHVLLSAAVGSQHSAIDFGSAVPALSSLM